jgi:hypothetical protein
METVGHTRCWRSVEREDEAVREDNIRGGIENAVDATSLRRAHSDFGYARAIGCNIR